MEKRACGYKGCRAWAKRGTAWCVAHPDGQPRVPTGWALPGNQKGRTHGLYSTYVPVAGLKEAMALPPGDSLWRSRLCGRRSRKR